MLARLSNILSWLAIYRLGDITHFPYKCSTDVATKIKDTSVISSISLVISAVIMQTHGEIKMIIRSV